MTESEILDWFEANRDERGVAHWEKGYAADSGLQSFGVGLTRLRKLAKKVGRDHELSQRLWTSPWYDVRVLALLVDDPKAITRAQAEEQVDQVQVGQLAHVFSSCDATLARAPFVRELAEEWMASGDSIRERCGYGLLYELSKSKKKSAPDEAWFLGWVEHMERRWPEAEVDLLCSMAGALIGVGKRSRALNAAALRVARAIGPIRFDPKCDPLDAARHLTSDSLVKKLGLG